MIHAIEAATKQSLADKVGKDDDFWGARIGPDGI